VVEVLSAWGQKEATSGKSDIHDRGRDGPLPIGDHERTIYGLEVILEHVPGLIGRLLLSDPVGARRVEFLSEDSTAMLLHNGRRPTRSWAEGFLKSESTEGRLARHNRALPSDHLVCSGQVAAAGLEVTSYVIWDGFHRLAEWLMATHAGSREPLRAYFIETKRPLVQLT
jgi:hypothetical protein